MVKSSAYGKYKKNVSKCKKMTGMANLSIELVCAWLNLTGHLSAVKVGSKRAHCCLFNALAD
jgi:hypothetical protein